MSSDFLFPAFDDTSIFRHPASSRTLYSVNVGCFYGVMLKE